MILQFFRIFFRISRLEGFLYSVAPQGDRKPRGPLGSAQAETMLGKAPFLPLSLFFYLACAAFAYIGTGEAVRSVLDKLDEDLKKKKAAAKAEEEKKEQ